MKQQRRAYEGKLLGGAEGDRTPDLVIANDALSQLSYSPDAFCDTLRFSFCQ